MFKSDSFVFFMTPDNERVVYHVINSDETHYTVRVPYFKMFGGIFSRWREYQITRRYLERKCQPLPEKLANNYRKIKKGDSTSILFPDD